MGFCYFFPYTHQEFFGYFISKLWESTCKYKIRGYLNLGTDQNNVLIQSIFEISNYRKHQLEQQVIFEKRQTVYKHHILRSLMFFPHFFAKKEEQKKNNYSFITYGNCSFLIIGFTFRIYRVFPYNMYHLEGQGDHKLTN